MLFLSETFGSESSTGNLKLLLCVSPSESRRFRVPVTLAIAALTSDDDVRIELELADDDDAEVPTDAATFPDGAVSIRVLPPCRLDDFVSPRLRLPELDGGGIKVWLNPDSK